MGKVAEEAEDDGAGVGGQWMRKTNKDGWNNGHHGCMGSSCIGSEALSLAIS